MQTSDVGVHISTLKVVVAESMTPLRQHTSSKQHLLGVENLR